jgi:hypothetical protein
MKRTIALICAAGLVAPIAAAQEQSPSAERRALVEQKIVQGTVTRVAIETKITRGKPYAGEAVTEFVQVLGDGNRIVRRTTERLFRDSEGRTRREPTDNESARSSVVITDPVAGNSFVLNPATQTATRSPATFASYNVSAAPAAGGEPKVEMITIPEAELRRKIVVTAEAAVAGGRGSRTVAVAGGNGGFMVAGAVGGESTREDLGQQQIEDVTANGTRTTSVIPAGAIGNEQAITIVSEQWFSPDLDVLVLTRHTDPRVGETTYRLTNISRNEPDRSLFQVPSDYTVHELRERKPPLMWERRQQ